MLLHLSDMDSPPQNQPSHADEDIERYTVASRKEILYILNGLADRKERITLLFNQGSDNLLTMLLAIDDDDGTIIFDWGGSEETNRKFLASQRSTFVTFQEGVRIQLQLGEAWETDYRGGKAFATHLPEKLSRVQRREFFRVSLPLSLPVRCALYTEKDEKLQGMMHDIGIGGVGIDSLTPIEFERSARLPRGQIDLGREFGVVECALEVCIVKRMELRSGKIAWRMGCAFINLHRSMEARIQRFMVKLERDQRAMKQTNI